MDDIFIRDVIKWFPITNVIVIITFFMMAHYHVAKILNIYLPDDRNIKISEHVPIVAYLISWEETLMETFYCVLWGAYEWFFYTIIHAH